MALVNQRVIYRILFRAGSETLLELGRDPKHLGGEIGVLAALHTWGRNQLEHPSRRGGTLHCDGWRAIRGRAALVVAEKGR